MTTLLTFDPNVAVAFVPIKAHHNRVREHQNIEKAIGEFMWRKVGTERDSTPLVLASSLGSQPSQESLGVDLAICFLNLIYRFISEPTTPPVILPSQARWTEAVNMSYMLPHLHNGWQVDQAILSEEERVVVVRFGHDWDPTCMQMDEILYKIADKVP